MLHNKLTNVFTSLIQLYSVLGKNIYDDNIRIGLKQNIAYVLY